ncbi:GNAT family N-acetyltransferase [Rahnella laticis]|uniref:GNAT family N-acetyltransferase n=1 Tax=Rahnella laticis TaxID=2787622 RepID=A0ABS0E5E9_9GAMM|nr:GNAT family N-acetyltransferase [Rahnella laticis]MBF7978509.1 GNAT family N-acetyltransferase [Rahnella laticis]MBF7998599.1 GNAT family N-acetyltransferase [Rahnella sp. LAC-M12]
MADLTIRIFSEDDEYDLLDFDCGEESLNNFLTAHLARQHKNRILRAYLLMTKEPKQRVVGYYTLSGSCFEKETLPSNTQKRKVPYENVPAITLGRLAVHKDFQGQEWGTTLVTHAMSVVFRASKAVGVHAMFVDALDERAKQFYLKLDFISLTGDNANSLFLPTKSIEEFFADE